MADLYADARQLHQAERWAVVIKVFVEIHEIEPDYPDPDELLSSARAAAEAEERAKRLAALYDQGWAHVDAQEWSQAAKCFGQIAQIEPEYRATEALLARVQQELATVRPMSEHSAGAGSVPMLKTEQLGHGSYLSFE